MSTSRSTSGVRRRRRFIRPPWCLPQVEPGQSELDSVCTLCGKPKVTSKATDKQCRLVNGHVYMRIYAWQHYHTLLHKRGTGLNWEHRLIRLMRRLAKPDLPWVGHWNDQAQEFYPVVRPHHECTRSRWLVCCRQTCQLFRKQLHVLSHQPVRSHPWMWSTYQCFQVCNSSCEQTQNWSNPHHQCNASLWQSRMPSRLSKGCLPHSSSWTKMPPLASLNESGRWLHCILKEWQNKTAIE